MESTEVNTKNWKSMIKPSKLDIKLSDDKSYAKIVAEPLEKGYGLTLGNSLRRILLSSIMVLSWSFSKSRALTIPNYSSSLSILSHLSSFLILQNQYLSKRGYYFLVMLNLLSSSLK